MGGFGIDFDIYFHLEVIVSPDACMCYLTCAPSLGNRNLMTILFNHLINGFGIRFDILFHGKVIVSQDACMCL